jgi:hypothetical protein
MGAINYGAQVALSRGKGRARIPYPCRFCHAVKLLPLSAVELHLKRDGRDPVGGWPKVGEYISNNSNDEVDMNVIVEGSNHEELNTENVGDQVLDQYHDVQQMFRDAMDLSVRIHKEAVQETSSHSRRHVQMDDPEEANIR